MSNPRRPLSVIPSTALEAIRRQLGIPDRVLDVDAGRLSQDAGNKMGALPPRACGLDPRKPPRRFSTIVMHSVAAGARFTGNQTVARIAAEMRAD